MSFVKEQQIRENLAYPNGSKSSLWKSVTVRLKENDLALLNNKLRVNGFGTFSEFVRAWLKGEYPRHENNEQVDKLLNRLRDNDIKDPITRDFNPTFYRNVDSEDMLNDLSKRYVLQKTCQRPCQILSKVWRDILHKT